MRNDSIMVDTCTVSRQAAAGAVGRAVWPCAAEAGVAALGGFAKFFAFFLFVFLHTCSSVSVSRGRFPRHALGCLERARIGTQLSQKQALRRRCFFFLGGGCTASPLWCLLRPLPRDRGRPPVCCNKTDSSRENNNLHRSSVLALCRVVVPAGAAAIARHVPRVQPVERDLRPVHVPLPAAAGRQEGRGE